jgi:hypothetical protein
MLDGYATFKLFFLARKAVLTLLEVYLKKFIPCGKFLIRFIDLSSFRFVIKEIKIFVIEDKDLAVNKKFYSIFLSTELLNLSQHSMLLIFAHTNHKKK